ncbi:hypothetical protein IF1G_08345 [Cordyceps javanica]|uniref:Uncharacterized protein n=1 Tax=Cordyceps javanica TaxID=43265 RepID=A0A545UU93_9HYPO|nr:hypothetical protein IF1G_08345 [Cordyceps javanica]
MVYAALNQPPSPLSKYVVVVAASLHKPSRHRYPRNRPDNFAHDTHLYFVRRHPLFPLQYPHRTEPNLQLVSTTHHPSVVGEQARQECPGRQHWARCSPLRPDCFATVTSFLFILSSPSFLGIAPYACIRYPEFILLSHDACLFPGGSRLDASHRYVTEIRP